MCRGWLFFSLMGSYPVSDTPGMVYSCRGSPPGGQWSLSGGGKGSCILCGTGFSCLLFAISFFLWLVSWLRAYPECGLLSFWWMGSSLVSFLVVTSWVRGRLTSVSPESSPLPCVSSVVFAVLLAVL